MDFSVCTVCFDGASDDFNPIIYCDKCGVAVHRICYGIQQMPDELEEWFCDVCQWQLDLDKEEKRLDTVLPKRTAQCCLCPIIGGAMKPTAEGGWAHLSCAIWLPGVCLGDVVTMSPVRNCMQLREKQEKEHLARSVAAQKAGAAWEPLQCRICDQQAGCTLECSQEGCCMRFHVMCAWYRGFYMKTTENDSKLQLQAYCEKCTPECMGGPERDFLKFRDMRLRGLTEMVAPSLKQDLLRTVAHHVSFKEEDQYDPQRCAICFERAFDDVDPLMPCTSCGVVVHRSCYGATLPVRIGRPPQDGKGGFGPPKMMESAPTEPVPNQMRTVKNPRTDRDWDWICDRCKEPNKVELCCAVCPRKGGALKKASSSSSSSDRWVHVVCALWIPELSFEEPLEMGPITGIGGIPHDRNNMRCYICTRTGGCIQCSDCSLGFHPLCGLMSGQYMKVTRTKEHSDRQEIRLIAKCKNHTPLLESKAARIPENYMKMLRMRQELNHTRLQIDLVKKRKLLEDGVLGCNFYLFKKRRRDAPGYTGVSASTGASKPRSTYQRRRPQPGEGKPCQSPVCWGKSGGKPVPGGAGPESLKKESVNLIELRGVCRQCYDRWYRIRKSLSRGMKVMDHDRRDVEGIESAMNVASNQSAVGPRSIYSRQPVERMPFSTQPTSPPPHPAADSPFSKQAASTQPQRSLSRSVSPSLNHKPLKAPRGAAQKAPRSQVG